MIFDREEHRVYGAPGTGKTTWIVDQVEELLKEYGPSQISICSLTNAAVNEVKSRGLAIGDENISTLHARCKRSLSSGSPAEARIKEFIKAYPNSSSRYHLPQMADSPESFLDSGEFTTYEKVNIYRQQMVPRSAWPAPDLHWFQDWDEWCKTNNMLDFTGWLEMSLASKSLPPQMVVFVDEAQDHTPLQLAVARSWGCKKVYFVGDDDQNLYEWSGAIPREFFKFPIMDGNEFVLEQSYRVPRAVHRLAMSITRLMSERYPKVYNPRDAEGKVMRIDHRIDYYERGYMPKGLLSEEGRYMILATCAYMLDDLIKMLRERGIPFYNPYRTSNTTWNPLSTSSAGIARCYLVSDWTGQNAKIWIEAMDNSLFSYHQAGADLLDLCKEKRYDILEVDELRPYFKEGLQAKVFSRDPQILIEFRRKELTGLWDYYVKVFEKDRDASPRLIIGTIHSVKGGEADVVYLYPDLSAAGYREYKDHPDRIHRLFYVGVTRAKEKVILCSPSTNMSYAFGGK